MHYMFVDLEKVDIKKVIDSLKGKFKIILEKDYFYYILVLYNYPGYAKIFQIECWNIKNDLIILIEIKEQVNHMFVYNEYLKFFIQYLINKLFDYKLIDENDIADGAIYKENGYIYFSTLIKLIDTEEFIQQLERELKYRDELK